jgi:hypothetical protein
VTVFSWAEEALAKREHAVPYNLEEELKKRGAKYGKSMIPFKSHVVEDDLLITCQNPASAGGRRQGGGPEAEGLSLEHAVARSLPADHAAHRDRPWFPGTGASTCSAHRRISLAKIAGCFFAAATLTRD